MLGFSYCLPMFQSQIAPITGSVDEFRTDMVMVKSLTVNVVVKLDTAVTTIFGVAGNVLSPLL